MGYRLIIAGGRDFDDFALLMAEADRVLTGRGSVEIVCGGAPGADELGRRYGEMRKLPIKTFPADWAKFGRAAGPKRNEQMARYADACLCFWDGSSKGTKSMISLAKRHGLELHIVGYESALQSSAAR